MDKIASPEFNPAEFDADFFAEYEAQLADMSVEDQASEALFGILTVKQEDGTEKTYEQIRDETRAFFDNDWVRQDEAMMNRLATEFAAACMAHNHGSELARDGVLSSVFEKGVHDVDAHGGHSHEAHSDEGKIEADSKSGKKKTRKKRKGVSLLALLVGERGD